MWGSVLTTVKKDTCAQKGPVSTHHKGAQTLYHGPRTPTEQSHPKDQQWKPLCVSPTHSSPGTPSQVGPFWWLPLREDSVNGLLRTWNVTPAKTLVKCLSLTSTLIMTCVNEVN